MSRNVQLKEKILEITEGVCESAVDMILMMTFFGLELGLRTKSSRSVYQAGRAAERALFDINYRTLKQALYRAREKGWIRPDDLKITSEGRRRMEGILPKNEPWGKWDGKWHIALFDIPEKQRQQRNMLRGFLKRLGFGKLFESTWISPIPLLGEVNQFVQTHRLDSYVILSISDKVGIQGSRDLAKRIWNLEEINNDYKNFLHSNETSEQKRIFQYLSITQRDPRLPKELLPVDWKGRRAKEYYEEFVKLTRQKSKNQNF